MASVRYGRPEDAAALSGVFDAAWREAYRGIIPAVVLSRMIARRGPRWWRAAPGAAGRSPSSRSASGWPATRSTAAPGSHVVADCKIDELYLTPEHQGLGFGTRLFRAVHNDLARRRGRYRRRLGAGGQRTRRRLLRRLGGRFVARARERFGAVALAKIAFLFGGPPR